NRVDPIAATDVTTLIADDSQVNVLQRFDNLAIQRPVLLPVDRKHHQMIAAHLLLNVRKNRQFLATRRTPGGPEGDDHDPAMIVAQLHALARSGFAENVRRNVTDLQLLLRDRMARQDQTSNQRVTRETQHPYTSSRHDQLVNAIRTAQPLDCLSNSGE